MSRKSLFFNLCALERRRIKPLQPIFMLSSSTLNKPHKLTINEFHLKADSTLDQLQDLFERVSDENSVSNSDFIYSSGVLTLKIGNDTFVINKQPPNLQLWLSSPRSGPKRFNFVNDKWVNERDMKEDLLGLVQSELIDLIQQSTK